MRALLLAIACSLAIAPAFAGHYGYRLGGSRLISGNPTVGLHVVRPSGVGQRQLYLAPRHGVRQVNPYTGRRTSRKPALPR